MLFTLLYSILYKLGKGIPLRETTAFFYVLTCLFFPFLGYTIYNEDNLLSQMFIKYMLVPEEKYYSTALPALAAFSAVITWPLKNKLGVSDTGEGFMKIIHGIKSTKTNKQKIGIIIVSVGIVMSLLAKSLPGSLGFVAILFYFSSFAGLLYLYYSEFSVYKYAIMTVFLLFILANALATGMFTLVAYMGITIFSFFFMGSKMQMWKKIGIVFLGVALLLILQVSKTAYREATWNSNYSGSKALLFGELFWENLQRGEGIFEKNEFFPIYTRMNQGWNISLVMKRMPVIQDHDNGKQLATVVAASIVPRLFWPDKPMAGGKFNMKHYAGVSISGFSTNVGPLGEGYGSFGRTGAIIFLAVLAFFIRWVYHKVFKIAHKIPLLICWLPVLFYQLTYSAETDTLQILNSIIKGSFFIWILYKLLPGYFGVIKRVHIKRPKPQPVNA